MSEKLKCKDCPRCKDKGKIDHNGNHFAICGMGGNMVYPKPRKVKRACGSGYIHYGAGSCGLYETVEQALSHMTEPEIRRWRKIRDDKRESVGEPGATAEAL